MHNIYSDLLKTKIHILSLSVSMADIAAERWEKGEKDPQWVTRGEDGKFSKSSGTPGTPSSNNIENNIFSKISSSVTNKISDLAEEANSNIAKLTRAEKAFAAKILQPTIESIAQSVEADLKKIDKSVFDGFKKAKELALDAIKKTEKNILNSIKNSASESVKNLKDFDFKEVVKPVIEYANSSEGKSLLHPLGIITAVGFLVGISVAATGAITSGLLAVGLVPNLSAELLMTYAIGRGILKGGFENVLKSIDDWGKEAATYEKSSGENNTNFSSTIKNVGKAIKKQLTKNENDS